MRRGKMVIFWGTLWLMQYIFTGNVLAAFDPLCEDGVNPTVNTALGCIPIRVDKFVEWLLPYLFGIAGGISFLLMVYGFIIVATSEGDPKKMAGGQETITSAIMGLLTSIFAIFILRLVTVGILKIPGMS